MGSGKDRRGRGGGGGGKGEGVQSILAFPLDVERLPPQDGESYFNAMMF